MPGLYGRLRQRIHPAQRHGYYDTDRADRAPNGIRHGPPGHEKADLEGARQRNQERIQKGETLVLELPGGELASMAHTSRETERGIAISGVYTPPEHRGHGYCQATVGALCREQLARGKDYCTLFVDRRNPVSNRVYRKIGFRVLEDCSEYKLT